MKGAEHRLPIYDLVYELTSAIIEDRPAVPGFRPRGSGSRGRRCRAGVSREEVVGNVLDRFQLGNPVVATFARTWGSRTRQAHVLANVATVGIELWIDASGSAKPLGPLPAVGVPFRRSTCSLPCDTSADQIIVNDPAPAP